jgi:hypothetical protein
VNAIPADEIPAGPARVCHEASWLAGGGAFPQALHAPCPWLPLISCALDPSVTRRHGADRGADFYLDALRYAQSLWMTGKPAQAILQLDKAWMADLGEAAVLRLHPPPCQALAWILARAGSGTCGYLGNPVRHFQHLASRMSGPRAEIRRWRAWFCLHLAERILPRPGFPRDGRQIAREGLWLPSATQSIAQIAAHGWPGEARHARLAIGSPENL